MIRSTRILGLLGAAALLLSCGKSASPPTTFGVNVTVDASALTAAHVSAARKGSLVVVVNGTAQAARTFDIQMPIQSREVRFHYVPDTGVAAGDKLAMGFDVLDAKGVIIASGSSKAVTLAATAVAVTIKLEDAGGGDGGTDGSPGDGGNPGKTNGTACVTGTECGSGFCADGVCCNEKCDDVCVSCSQTATKGMCTPFAVDTDPDLECGPKLPPMTTEPDDAGAPAPAPDGAAADGPAADGPAMSDAAKPIDGGDAGGDAMASTDASDAGASDAVVYNPPDGGFMSMPKTCGGTCGGARACKFPGKEKPCGTAFCNTPKQPGAFVCDGMGSCNIALSTCNDFACDEATGACRTRCTAHSDCVAGDYCDGPTHACGPKNGLGLKCTTDEECQTGHCSTGVCCNTACDTAPLSCNNSGSVGQCKCAECTTGPCQIYYPDGDADGFGDRTATYALHTAKAGCANAPPVGFVADNTDCDDKDPMAHPGQTAFFGFASKGGRFDYDCDDKTTKETPEYIGGSCRLCGAVGACDTATSCTAMGQTASFQCPQEYGGLIRAALPPGSSLGADGLEPMSLSPELVPPTGQASAEPALAPRAAPGAVLPPICKVCVLQCCGCAANDKTGFRQTVGCGVDTVPAYTCGSCTTATGPLSAMTTSYRQQRCR